MNYWQRWIGKWKKKTGHLPMECKGAYGEILDWIYANEAPLPLDLADIYRIAGAGSAAERASVRRVLDEFFEQSETGYMQSMATEEIAARQEYVAGQRDRANLRWHQPAKPPANGQHPPAQDESFAAFWSAYPRKVAKADALKAWAKLAPGDELHPLIIRAVLAQSAGAEWRKEGGRYIPHPASWLNARRWEDEAPAPKPKPFPI